MSTCVHVCTNVGVETHQYLITMLAINLVMYIHVNCTLHQITYQEEEELFRACESGDVETVKRIAGRVNVTAVTGGFKWTPLHSAAT